MQTLYSYFDFRMQEKMIAKSKHSQAWGIDLMIAVMIFTIGILFFYLYTLNAGNPEKKISEMNKEGNLISDSLLSSGYPQDWNSENVVKIGIVDNGKINETKLERFFNLASSDYEKTKDIFKTRYDYYFSLSENMTINSQQVEGIGKKSGNEKNLVRVSRFVIYKDTPLTMYINIWEGE